MTKSLIERRRPVWIALSDLWLDNEIDDGRAKDIAKVILASGFSESEIEEIFVFELAPVLYRNHLDTAGIWSGFDPERVREEAEKRMGNKRLVPMIAAKIGITTFGARQQFERVKALAFGKGPETDQT